MWTRAEYEDYLIEHGYDFRIDSLIADGRIRVKPNGLGEHVGLYETIHRPLAMSAHPDHLRFKGKKNYEREGTNVPGAKKKERRKMRNKLARITRKRNR